MGLKGHRQRNRLQTLDLHQRLDSRRDSHNSQTSITEVEEDSCPPKEFMGLKNGGKRNSYIVEGILFQSGRLWLKNQRWVVRKFSQL